MEDLEAIRLAFRPAQIRILLVGESPPRKRGFFYTGDSTLFRETAAVMALVCGFPSDPKAFLESFRNAGFYLDDFSPIRGDKPARRPDDSEVQKSVSRIGHLIAAHQPRAVVAVLESLRRLLDDSLAASGQTTPAHVLRFPNWRDPAAQRAYREGLKSLLKDYDCGRTDS